MKVHMRNEGSPQSFVVDTWKMDEPIRSSKTHLLLHLHDLRSRKFKFQTHRGGRLVFIPKPKTNTTTTRKKLLRNIIFNVIVRS